VEHCSEAQPELPANRARPTAARLATSRAIPQGGIDTKGTSIENIHRCCSKELAISILSGSAMCAGKAFYADVCSLLVLFAVLTGGAPSQESSPAQTAASPAKVDDAGKPSATARPKPATPFLQGVALYQSEDFTGALNKFTEAGNSGGEDAAAAYAWLARAQLRLKHPDSAEAAAKRALELKKDLPTAQSAMGEVYFRQGNFPAAEEVFRKILLAKIEDPRACLGLAKIYWATANRKSAKVLIDQAHALNPRDPDIFWAWLRTLGRQERLSALKARLMTGSGEDAEEQAEMSGMLAVLEDREDRPERGCKLITKLDSTETKLEPLMTDSRHMRGYGLAVKVNDKSANLLIDTGASGILINSKVAEKAGVEKIVSHEITGIGDKGASHGYVAYAKEIQVGNLQFENCYVDVVDRKSSLDEEGLIGTDVFEDFLVDLDFPNAKFRLSQLPPFPDEPARGAALHSSRTSGPSLHNRYIPPEYKNFEKVYRFGHILALPTRLNNASPKLFLLDTGAWDNTVTPAAAQEATKVYSEPDIKVKGLNGEVKNVYTTGEITLTFGKFQQHRRDLVAFDTKGLSDSVGTEISGTLGFVMLYVLEIKIDYRDYLVDFTYDPNRIH
jgi:tetratricopeptide (TPR) repeat protein